MRVNNKQISRTLLAPMMLPRLAILRVILFCLYTLFLSTPAHGIEGLSGSTWGNLTQSVNGLTGSGAEGWIRQGVDWFSLPGGITFDTYAEYRFRTRTKQQQYYNAQGPVLGLEFKKSSFRLGLDYYWEEYPDWPGGTQRSHNREFYLTGYYNWDARKLINLTSSKIVGLPGAVWFNLTYDINGLTGSGAQGWINQGLDWFTLPHDIIFNTYAEYRYRAQTKQREYYNAYGPALGIELKKSYFRLGTDYYWETYPDWPGGAQHSNYLEVYLTWYIDWDLLKSVKSHKE